MESQVIQKVFNNVSVYLPSGWKKFALYIAFSGNTSFHKFYVDTGNGYVDCFHLGYDKPTLRNIFISIEDILLEERQKLPQKKTWNIFTMFVYGTGKFEINFGYEDVSDTFLEHHQKWENDFII